MGIESLKFENIFDSRHLIKSRYYFVTQRSIYFPITTLKFKNHNKVLQYQDFILQLLLKIDITVNLIRLI